MASVPPAMRQRQVSSYPTIMTRPRKGTERTEAGKVPRAADGAARRGARTGALVPLALAAILAAGFAVRMMPGWRDPALELLSDAAYHARLVAETERAGRLPKLDLLSEAPAGRVTAERHRGYWLDVGTPARLAELDRHLRMPPIV